MTIIFFISLSINNEDTKIDFYNNLNKFKRTEQIQTTKLQIIWEVKEVLRYVLAFP